MRGRWHTGAAASSVAAASGRGERHHVASAREPASLELLRKLRDDIESPRGRRPLKRLRKRLLDGVEGGFGGGFGGAASYTTRGF